MMILIGGQDGDDAVWGQWYGGSMGGDPLEVQVLLNPPQMSTENGSVVPNTTQPQTSLPWKRRCMQMYIDGGDPPPTAG